MAHSDIENVYKYGLSVPTRTIRLSGYVGDEMADCLAAGLDILDREPGTLTIQLQTFGGECYAGFAIYDLIRSSPSWVVLRGMGPVMSMGVLILQAGDERELTPHATVMLHEPSTWFRGKLSDMKIDAAELERIWDQYAGIVAPKMKISAKQFKRWHRGDRYLDAQEAVRLRLADRVRK